MLRLFLIDLALAAIVGSLLGTATAIALFGMA